jgi:hypothetical protein
VMVRPTPVPVAEEAREPRHKTLPKKQSVDLLGFRCHVSEGQIRIDLRHAVAYRGKNGLWIGRHTQLEERSFGGPRFIHHRPDFPPYCKIPYRAPLRQFHSQDCQGFLRSRRELPISRNRKS